MNTKTEYRGVLKIDELKPFVGKHWREFKGFECQMGHPLVNPKTKRIIDFVDTRCLGLHENNPKGRYYSLVTGKAYTERIDWNNHHSLLYYVIAGE